MKRSAFIVAAFVLLVFCCSLAQAMEPVEIADAFFGKLKEGDVSAAYDVLFIDSDIPELKPQEVNVLKVQTSNAIPMYGAILGAELIHEEYYGTSVVRLVYILKQEDAPTVWQFFFYKPTDTWSLGTVFFNDQYQFIQKMQ